MRRFAAVIALALLANPFHASARGWSTFRDPKMAFALQYPPGWKVSGTPALGLVVLQSGTLSINVRMVPVRPGRNALQTARAVARLDPALSRVQWTRTTLGGRPARAGVDSPPTEGGVSVSDGIYVVTWRRRVYEVIIASYHKPALKRLSQFPAIYGQILRTWRFL